MCVCASECASFFLSKGMLFHYMHLILCSNIPLTWCPSDKMQIYFYSFLDKDECLAKPCSQVCTNKLNGEGYACSCNDGYKLDTDGKSCKG